jgi:glycosyltransferase involved in cell wall biosynthesis
MIKKKQLKKDLNILGFNKMKVCILTTSFPAYKGHFQSPFIYNLAKALSEKATIDVVCPFYKESKNKFEVWNNIKIHRFQYFYPRLLQKLTSDGGIPSNLESSLISRIQFPLFLLSMFLKSRKVVKKCDIIHAQWALSALIGIFLKKIYKKLLVLTTRGAADLAFKNSLSKKILVYILKNCDYIAPNNYNHEKIIAKLGIAENKIKTIPNGIDVDIFKLRNKSMARKNLNLPLNKRIILSVGWLIPRKGYDYLLDAIPSITKEHNDSLFIIIGDGLLKDRLIKKVNDLKIQNYVKFIKSQSPNKIPLWMNAADIFILPSLSEGRPNVIPEAMASGLPVIATAVSGTPEFIKDNKDGFLINPKDSNAIATKIIGLLDHPEKIEIIKKEARKSIINKGITWKKCSDSFINIYNYVLNKK